MHMDRDLSRFVQFCPNGFTCEAEVVREYIDLLYKQKLSSRSIARHLTAIRNFYQFLLREGKVSGIVSRTVMCQ